MVDEDFIISFIFIYSAVSFLKFERRDADMAVEWYYLKSGWFKSTKVGPVSESTFLKSIDAGEIDPQTLILCESKTRGHWVRMDKVAPAMKRWEKAQQRDKGEVKLRAGTGRMKFLVQKL